MKPYDLLGRACLTARQRKVLRWIEKYHDKRGYMPSFREIAKGLRMSQTGVVYHLRCLSERGALIRNERDSARCAYLLPKGAPVVGTVKDGRVVWK